MTDRNRHNLIERARRINARWPGASAPFAVGAPEMIGSAVAASRSTRWLRVDKRRRVSVTPPRWMYYGVEVAVAADYTATPVAGGWDSAGPVLPQSGVNPAGPQVTDPVPGVVLVPDYDGQITWTWDPVADATAYRVSVGSTAGGVEFGQYTLTSVEFSLTLDAAELSNDGSIIYVRLEAEVDSAWGGNTFSYYDPASLANLARNTAEVNSAPDGPATWPPVQSNGVDKTKVPADAIIIPVGGPPVVAWTPTGEDTTEWSCAVNPPSVEFEVVGGVAYFHKPLDLLTQCAGYRVPWPVDGSLAQLISPAPDGACTGTSQTFTIAGVVDGEEYWLMVGDLDNGLGSGDYYNASMGTSTSQAVTGLPDDGRLLCVRVGTRKLDGPPYWGFNEHIVEAYTAP